MHLGSSLLHDKYLHILLTASVNVIHQRDKGATQTFYYVCAHTHCWLWKLGSIYERTWIISVNSVRIKYLSSDTFSSFFKRRKRRWKSQTCVCKNVQQCLLIQLNYEDVPLCRHPLRTPRLETSKTQSSIRESASYWPDWFDLYL